MVSGSSAYPNQRRRDHIASSLRRSLMVPEKPDSLRYWLTAASAAEEDRHLAWLSPRLDPLPHGKVGPVGFERWFTFSGNLG